MRGGSLPPLLVTVGKQSLQRFDEVGRFCLLCYQAHNLGVMEFVCTRLANRPGREMLVDVGGQSLTG